MKGLDYTALILTITGAINWGLVGLFKFDLVAFLFGNLSWLSRIIYITLREFLKLSRQSPRSRVCTDFGSLLA